MLSLFLEAHYICFNFQNSVLVQEIIPASYPTQVLWSLKNEKDLPGIPASLEIYTNAQSTTLVSRVWEIENTTRVPVGDDLSYNEWFLKRI